MQQVSLSFEDTFERSFATRILSLEETDLNDRYPIQLISTDLPTLVVPLRSLDAIARSIADGHWLAGSPVEHLLQHHHLLDDHDPFVPARKFLSLDGDGNSNLIKEEMILRFPIR